MSSRLTSTSNGRRPLRLLILVCLILLQIRFVYSTSTHSFLAPDTGLLPNGLFHPVVPDGNGILSSDNGVFWCSYELGRVGDEVRELLNFTLHTEDTVLYTLDRAPGSDVYISNSGIVAFLDHKRHYRREVTISFYSRSGRILDNRTFRGASLFGFSPSGKRFAVGTAENLILISPIEGSCKLYERGLRFDISENDSLFAVATEQRIQVYSGKTLILDLRTRSPYLRRIKISSEGNLLAVIYKRDLDVFSLEQKELLFTDSLEGELSYRDLMIKEGNILAGIHHRSAQVSKGILRVYDSLGRVLSETKEATKILTSVPKIQRGEASLRERGHIPWPFVPFDSVHTVWNYYEQHMGGYGAEWSYLHQGLDIITPIGEPTYSVSEGIVKCVLTLGGPQYWRLAVSKDQNAGRSNGWLYAHLIEGSIQVDIGDTVHVHDYLGDIIQWADDWGHIHFVEISDSGLVWQYMDDEWGITHNPLLSLVPDTDFVPPTIEPVFESSMFAFSENETSNYLDPDSLYGDIDIIAKVKDSIGESPWVQPAFRTYYWVRRLPDADLVLPRTLGHILNHSYDFYASEHYEPYARVIYKRDDLLLPSSWMDMERNFYHCLTNSNGDSLVDVSESELAFATADHPDGDYRIYVEVFDEYGNGCVDSMDVQFRNGVAAAAPDGQPGLAFLGGFPNPCTGSTQISYWLPEEDLVAFRIYDMGGREVRVLVNGVLPTGHHSTRLGSQGMSSGAYLCRLQGTDSAVSRRLVFLP